MVIHFSLKATGTHEHIAALLRSLADDVDAGRFTVGPSSRSVEIADGAGYDLRVTQADDDRMVRWGLKAPDPEAVT